MALAAVDQRGLLLAQMSCAFRAPGAEPATGRRVDRRGHVALEHDPLRFALALGSGIGTADSSACVYGCAGSCRASSPRPISTILPRYITATRSEMCRTTDRSWAMNR